MSPDERDLLQRFLQDLVQTRSQQKDPEADAMIADALRGNPDAAYLLVQHAILSDQALHAAQVQIQALQSQVDNAPATSSSFLSAPSPWGQPRGPDSPPPQFVGGGPFSQGSGLGGFLRQAGTMAAGVAAGDMLFSGLEGLFGGHPFGGNNW